PRGLPAHIAGWHRRVPHPDCSHRRQVQTEPKSQGSGAEQRARGSCCRHVGSEITGGVDGAVGLLMAWTLCAQPCGISSYLPCTPTGPGPFGRCLLIYLKGSPRAEVAKLADALA